MKKKIDIALGFDLDATLISTFEGENEDDNPIEMLKSMKLYSDPKNMKYRNQIYTMSLTDIVSETGKGDVLNMWGIYRPHSRELISWCQDNFTTVFVWSAGRYQYVHSLVELLFENEKPEVVLTYDDCQFEKNYPKYKPLEKIYSSCNCNEKNTLIIDDNENTFQYNVDNAVHIPDFSPSHNLEGLKNQDDVCLFQLKEWLDSDSVRKCKDVRELDKSKIFMEPYARQVV